MRRRIAQQRLFVTAQHRANHQRLMPPRLFVTKHHLALFRARPAPQAQRAKPMAFAYRRHPPLGLAQFQRPILIILSRH